MTLDKGGATGYHSTKYNMTIYLEKDKPRTLAYGTFLREDLKLLEVSEELLQELQEDGYAGHYLIMMYMS